MAKQDLKAELERLRVRLAEAEETLEAIRSGEVDALVVGGPQGEQIYTLRGADRSYRMLLEEMNQGAATLMLDGTILYCNRRLAEMVQAPLESMIGAQAADLAAPADRELFEGLLRRGGRELAKAELALAAADGRTTPAYCSVNLIDIDGLDCLCLVATDLTEQKRGEEVMASEKLARHILERAVDVIVVCDENGLITRASRAARHLAGAGVLQRRFDEVFPIVLKDAPANDSNGAPGSGPFDIKFLGGRTVQGVEAGFARADGKKFDLLMSAGSIRDVRERSRGWVLTLTDITRLKRTEEELRESEQKLRRQAEELEQQLIATGRLVSLGEITASMAHEFNNPLGIVLGFAEDLLSEKGTSDPDYKGLKIIHEETKRCQRIIQELLEYSRPRPTEARPTDIKQLVEKSLHLVTHHLYKRKIKTAVEIEPDLPAILADGQQLEQVLVNLFFNAIDAMPDGGAPDAPAVVISVTDTGTGIAPEDLPRVFQPFFSKGKKSGLGLGLPICDRIIRNHGGGIEVESRSMAGTTFKISLPLERGPAAARNGGTGDEAN